MSLSTLSRRSLGALAAASLLLGLVPTAASAATPEKRDITRFACPADEVPDPGFSDDDDTTAEHRASIWCVVWYEIAKGRTTTTYAPGAAVNRGQMATFIGNLLIAGGVTLPSDPDDAFSDDDNTQHEHRINQLAELGVVEGDRDGRYNPHLAVTRAQMASFLNRAYAEITGAPLTSSEDFFTDDEGAFHEDNINAVAGAGIAAGKTSSTYAPAESVKRDQMATFLARETDLLVEEGRIAARETLPADVRLTTTSVHQGGKVEGTIVTQEGVEITEARVSGCGLTNHQLTLSGDDHAFAFTIPVTQQTGDCTLAFTLDVKDGETVTDEERITVTSGADRTSAPELVNVAAVSSDTTNKTVTVRYTFDEALRQEALTSTDFRLYSASADPATADSANHSGAGTVDAVFSETEFANATTATVTANAVEDLQAATNPEGAVPLDQESREVKGTAAPDLIKVVKAAGDAWTYEFDETIVLHPGDAGDYHLVLHDGTVLEGDSIQETDETDDGAVTVSFTDTYDESAVVRGWVAADTVASRSGNSNPLDGVEGGNPTHAEDVGAGGGDTPYLLKAEIDATNNQVIYTFNRSVIVPSRSTVDTTSYFVAYDLDGNEVATNNATASGSTVTATFSGSSDPITGSTVGASVRAGAVQAASGTRRVNQVDEFLAKSTTTVSGARGGETSAPDLNSVTRSIDGNDTVITYTFDQPATRFSSPNDPTNGDFAIYQADGTRTAMDLNDASGNECTVSGNTVECRATSTSTLGQQMDSAVLGGVEHDAVASTVNSADPPRNYEASAPIVE